MVRVQHGASKKGKKHLAFLSLKSSKFYISFKDNGAKRNRERDGEKKVKRNIEKSYFLQVPISSRPLMLCSLSPSHYEMRENAGLLIFSEVIKS